MLQTITLSLCFVLVAATNAEELRVVTERKVDVPMRDGVILRASVHRPDRGGPYPVLVLRTPYNFYQNNNFGAFVKAGYIVVVQHARGRFTSDGQWESFLRFETHDAEDGYDTVQWAAKLPGSTGKVGTMGASYNAFLQWRLAPLRPPSLVCMSAWSIPGRYIDLEGPGTIRPGRRLQWWIPLMSPNMRKRSGRQASEEFKQLAAGGTQKYLWYLPWLELPRGAFEEETEAVHYWLKNPHTDPWKLDEGVKEISVPNFDMVGWHDHCNGDMLLHKTMVKEAKTETARNGSRIMIGPWSHVGRGSRRAGKIDFGVEAVVNVTALEIRWFDYWLKGKQNGVDKDAPVKIFVMGENRWRDEQHWPLKRTRDRVLFITSGGKANTPGGDGRIVDQGPTAGGADRYVYDPADPVPSQHGRGSFARAADQRSLADRRDILVYQSEPVTERIEVTGNPVVELYASSSAPDTDWFVRLIDVAPDGEARDISLGVMRARYRNGLDKPELIEPGQIVKYTIRMNATSNAFLPGHRIRLDITSSDFPSHDRNHNTTADQNADATLATAQQTIHHGGTSDTRIVLPCVPNEE